MEDKNSVKCCRILGGEELTLEEYTSYLNMLRAKPLLSPSETAVLFNIGLNRVHELMNAPDCDFVTSVIGPRRRLVHRESFERYVMAHQFREEEV